MAPTSLRNTAAALVRRPSEIEGRPTSLYTGKGMCMFWVMRRFPDWVQRSWLAWLCLACLCTWPSYARCHDGQGQTSRNERETGGEGCVCVCGRHAGEVRKAQKFRKFDRTTPSPPVSRAKPPWPPRDPQTRCCAPAYCTAQFDHEIGIEKLARPPVIVPGLCGPVAPPLERPGELGSICAPGATHGWGAPATGPVGSSLHRR